MKREAPSVWNMTPSQMCPRSDIARTECVLCLPVALRHCARHKPNHELRRGRRHLAGRVLIRPPAKVESSHFIPIPPCCAVEAGCVTWTSQASASALILDDCESKRATTHQLSPMGSAPTRSALRPTRTCSSGYFASTDGETATHQLLRLRRRQVSWLS